MTAAGPAVEQPIIADDIEFHLVDVCCGQYSAILDACRRLLPGWAAIATESVEFNKITGGISNQLVKVAPTGPVSHVAPVAVKVFGERTELIVDSDTERQVLVDLNTHGFGAKVLAFFGNGRIEEYLHVRALQPSEMSDPRLVPCIARRLRAFQDAHIHLSKQATLSPLLRRWLRTARQLDYGAGTARARQHAGLEFHTWQAEIQELEGLCAAVDSPVVFSHNDLLSGNIVLPEGDVITEEYNGALQLISSIQHTPIVASTLVIIFVNMRGSNATTAVTRAGSAAEVPTALPARQRPCSSRAVTGRARSNVRGVRFVCTCGVHVYWGIWAVIQACYSTIDTWATASSGEASTTGAKRSSAKLVFAA